MKGVKAWLLFIGCCFVLIGCGSDQSDNNEDANRFIDENEEITVQIMNKDEDQIGTAVLTETNNGVQVNLQATNLPEGELAFHFHEYAQCDAPDYESAGKHFNPEEKDHGFDHPNGPHAGDMPNIEVTTDGTVNYEEVNKMVTLKESEENSLINEDGTSIIIHEGPDDSKSQPAGGAGARIACGIIEK